MLKEHDYILSKLNMALDLLVTAFAFVTVHLLRNYVLAPYVFPNSFRLLSRFSDYWWLILVLPVFTVVLLKYNGHYQSQRVRPAGSVFWVIFLSCAGASVCAMIMSFVFTPRGNLEGVMSRMFRGDFVSRGILLLYPPMAAVLLIVKTGLVRYGLINLRNKGFNTRHILIVGDVVQADKFAEHLARHPQWGYRIDGVLTNVVPGGTLSSSLPVLGGYDDIGTYLENHVIDDVVFVTSRGEAETIAPMLELCEEMGIRTRLPIEHYQHRISHPVIDKFDDMPVITYYPVREFGRALFIKYTFDRLAAAVLLVLLLPLFVIIGLVIKLTSGGAGASVFYGQPRTGLMGREFTLWKFRSMVPNAHQALADLQSHNEMTGPVFKMKNDPRITRTGRWLRKYSLDELPQLWNVLMGDMSLVGPRPPLPSEVANYDRWQRRRLSMKPGITCLWQVSGRNTLSFETWMRLDLEYIDNWSLWLDFKILCRTLYVVATGYGAM